MTTKTPAELNKAYADAAALLFDMRRKALDAGMDQVARDLWRHYEYYSHGMDYWAQQMQEERYGK